MADGGLVRLHDLPHEVSQCAEGQPVVAIADTDDLSAIQRAKIIDVLRREAGNKARAARALGIDRRKLYRLLDKYDIRPAEVNHPASR